MSSSDEYRGILSRKKGFFGSWVKGTYVKKGHYLFEYKLGANHVSSEPLETFELEGCLIEDGHQITAKPTSFVFHSVIGKSFFFLAPNMADKAKWMQLLQEKSVGGPQASTSAPQLSPAPQASIPQASASADIPTYEESRNYPLADDAKAEDLEAKMPILRFLESFTDPVIVGNSSGAIVAVNSAAERLFGYPKGELRGAPISMLMPEPFKSQHDGYLFRHEKFGTEKLVGKTRNLKGERKGEDVIDIQISLGKLPVKGYFIATIREIDLGDNQSEKPLPKKS